MSVPSPPPSSLVHRERIAHLLTPLRRIRPTVPYYKLSAHRVPTLWTLYRGLLRHAEHENVKWRIRTLFEAKRHTIQAHVAKEQLERAYTWLAVFVRAKQGQAYPQAVLERYDRMIASKRERREFGRLVREALEEQAHLHARTIFKGSFMRPTLYNTLLPRLDPQPVSIACMIHKRRLGRERRYAQSIQLVEWIKDLQMECTFERQLRRCPGVRIDPVFSDALDTWLKPLQDKLRIIRAANAREYDRLYSAYPSSLLLRGVRARQQKIRYLTCRAARERAGEVFPSTLARMRQGPPAHVRAGMSPEARRIDATVRGPGEAGYTAAAKMRLGRRLKDGEGWKREDGREEAWASLETLEEVVREENLRRRSVSRDCT